MSETIWSLLPPVVTIILALVTKEVYMSLAIGIFMGAFMFTGFSVLGAIDTMFKIMSDKVGGNVYIRVFLVLLGIMVAAIQKSGASQAYGDYAARTIKGKKSALFVTMVLGVLIFIDDYFNCLTVGTVMRPVTDRFKITRAKLAYIIDATAPAGTPRGSRQAGRGPCCTYGRRASSREPCPRGRLRAPRCRRLRTPLKPLRC